MKKPLVALIIGVLLLGIPAQSLAMRRLDDKKRKGYWESGAQSKRERSLQY